MTTKIQVAYHVGFGAFRLPQKALNYFNKISKTNYQDGYDVGYCVKRHDARLVATVQKFKKECADVYIKLHTLDGNRYVIVEQDGWEVVREPEDIDWIIAIHQDDGKL